MRRASAVVAVALVAATAGCAAAPAPPDVAVVVYQPRSYVAHGELAIQVVNGSDAALEVAGARLESPDFVAPATWPGDGVAVPAGLARDLRTPLPEIVCDAVGDPVVVLDVVVDGAIATLRTDFDDPFDLLPRVHAERCLDAEIARLAAIVPARLVAPGGAEPAILEFEVTPTGEPGTIELVALDGTTLLQPAVDGRPVPDRLDLGIAIGADGPRAFAVPLVPNRCDPHAVAEDKVGTILPFVVATADAPELRWSLPLPPRLRADAYRFVAGYCGFPAG